MHLGTVSIRNYRRLKNTTVDLAKQTSVFVGANNSGKTSATQLLQSFLGRRADREKFSIYDFSAECWQEFNRAGEADTPAPTLPAIGMDLWFEVGVDDLVHVRNLLPNLDWNEQPIGVRMEYCAADPAKLLSNFREARDQARRRDAQASRPGEYRSWPTNLTDYLLRRLTDEYTIRYYVLDRAGFDEAWREKFDYTPAEVGSARSALRDIRSLIRVDFLGAQRHLTDADAGSRAEDLSRRLSRYYEQTLQTDTRDLDTEQLLAESEANLNEHFTKAFDPLLKRLRRLGYPGFADPHLVVRTVLSPERVLGQGPSVHYSLGSPGSQTDADALVLPDKYNGLGFKNLIYMVVETLDFQAQWEADEERAPLHLLVIEEPEAHLHAQLQQVFIQQIGSLLPDDEQSAFRTQLIVTTHSSHILRAAEFESVRYFRRTDATERRHRSEVLNLSCLKPDDAQSRTFMRRYMKLTHFDLFFADAAILIEGDVERLLLPLMIKKAAPELNAAYISILEIGGAHAHIFRGLVNFLGLPTLVITDLDSVLPRSSGTDTTDDVTEADAVTDVESDEDSADASGTACPPDTPGAVTSNQVLKTWIPGLTSITDLASASEDDRLQKATDDERARVRVAYQSYETVVWEGESGQLIGRTFEIAFAYRNLAWCQHEDRKALRMRVKKRGGTLPSLAEAALTIHNRVTEKRLKKTDFALALLDCDDGWEVPSYIDDGLIWLRQQLQQLADDPAALAEPSASDAEPTQ